MPDILAFSAAVCWIARNDPKALTEDTPTVHLVAYLYSVSPKTVMEHVRHLSRERIDR